MRTSRPNRLLLGRAGGLPGRAWCWCRRRPLKPASYVPISGAGSTWSQVAVDAWRADVRASGVVVNYAGTGSTDGRSQFIQGTVDFANTEIPFQNPPEPGQQAEIPNRPFAYLPMVAGGTSFMYNLTVGGQRVTDLRLSGTHARQDLHRPDHPLERPGDQQRLRQDPARHPDHPGRPLRRRRRVGAVHQVHGEPGHRRCTARSSASKLHLGGSACPSVSFYPAFGS